MNGCSHSHARILPLNTVRAHVNTMTSLRLPFKSNSPADLHFKPMYDPDQKTGVK